MHEERQGSVELPPVSVIIPTFNRAAVLGRAMDSVLGQTYPHFELIVVDDGSTDQTRDLVVSCDATIRYLYQPNQGPAAARNAGIAAARFDLLAFLDSDDCFVPQKLTLQVAAMQAAPACRISHTNEIWYRNGLHLNQKKKHRKASGDIFAQSLALCVVGMSTVMARREFFARVGLFDETFPCCEDYDLWLRASPSESFLLVDEPLTIKHGGRPDQLSVRHRIGMDRYRIRSIEKLLSHPALTPLQRELALAELIRKGTIYSKGCLKHGKADEAAAIAVLLTRYR